MNIEAEVASTSFGYSEFIPPDSARDFDSDGVEIVRFQLAQIEYHSMTCHPPVCDADSEVETGASDELSSYDHLLENPVTESGRPEPPHQLSSSAEPRRSIGSSDGRDQAPGAGSTDHTYLHLSSVRRVKSAESSGGTEMQSLMTGRQDSTAGQQYS